ncbi:MAG: hypothetical protein HeimC3_38240 [Candidatus Heimdallarchaeota archaeon LC_3]|nr:MAG: hypothetical protein HeimC3_38240 [Candidatus Heimdallarchaeota archaeon LC_3]
MNHLQTTDFNDPVQLILLIIGLILTALVLYLAIRIITGKKELDASYFIKLFLVALVIYLALIAVSAVIGALDDIGAAFAQAIPILVFTAAIYIIDIFLVESKDKDKSVLIALITFIFLYVLEYIVVQLTSSQYSIIPIV